MPIVLQDVLADLLGVAEETTAIHQWADAAFIGPKGVATHIRVLKCPFTPLNTHDRVRKGHAFEHPWVVEDVGQQG